MARPGQLEMDDLRRLAGTNIPDSLEEQLLEMIDGSRQCRTMVAGVNPETGEYRILVVGILGHGADPERLSWDPRSTPTRMTTKGSVEGPESYLDYLHALEHVPATRSAVREGVGALIEHSASVQATLEAADDRTGAYRLALTGALKRRSAPAPTGPRRRPFSTARSV